MESTSKKSGFDVLFVVNIVLKYKIPLIVIAVLSIILSAVFSSEYFIKPKFKSTAIVYPSNLVPYSTESPTEQMLQLFESDDIRDELIRDFDLFNSWGNNGGIVSAAEVKKIRKVATPVKKK